MSLNDREILKQSAKGDLYPGFANPTTSSSLMPTDPREANFVRHVISLFDSFQILIWEGEMSRSRTLPHRIPVQVSPKTSGDTKQPSER